MKSDLAFVQIGVSSGRDWPGSARSAVCVRVSVLSVGELLFDCIKGGSCLPGGAPANVASALVKLGNPSGLLTAVGNDEDGQKLLDSVNEQNVDISLVQRLDDYLTRKVIVDIAEDGDRAFVGFAGADNKEFADAHLQKVVSLPSDLRTLITGTLALAFPTSGESLIGAATTAQSMGATVLTDINWRPVFWDHVADEDAKIEILNFVRKYSNVVKISDNEVEFLFGTPTEQAMDDPETVLNAIGGKVSGVLITAGPRGASFAFRSDLGEVSKGMTKGFKVEAVDTTGAGDAFVAGFVSEALLCSSDASKGFDQLSASDLEAALNFGCATGALTACKLGAMDAQPLRATVEEFLRQ